MIPGTELLEQVYEPKEVAALEAIRKHTEKLNPERRKEVGRQALRALWQDEVEYISKTHWIRTKRPGEIKLFVPNYAQKRLYRDVIQRSREENKPIRGIILKARQLGFSTFIQSWQFEQCDREKYRGALTISYDETSTELLFRKSKFVLKQQYFPRETESDRGNYMQFEHGSSLYCVTAGNDNAGRGDTIQHLHCSEIPMWVNADETLNSVSQSIPSAPNTSVFYESTARGAVGQFYDDWNAAESGRSDFIPFFAPWFWDPDYSLEFASADVRQVFGRDLTPTERRLEQDHRLSLEQLHWRRYTIRNLCQGSEAKFRQEYPSTPQEAFLTTGSPVFNADTVSMLERHKHPPLWTGHIHLEKQE